jgi:hypothetical protein
VIKTPAREIDFSWPEGAKVVSFDVNTAGWRVAVEAEWTAPSGRKRRFRVVGPNDLIPERAVHAASMWDAELENVSWSLYELDG